MTKCLFFLLMLFSSSGFSQETASLPPEANEGIYCSASTTWNGSTWSNGYPAIDKDVIFNADYACVSGTLYACSIFVLEGSHVSFPENSNALVVHNINVAESASLVFENNSNLVQTEATENVGNITIKRKSIKIVKDDHILWSSPVSGAQTLLDFSPQTLINRFYSFDTENNIYNTISDPENTTFTKAKGYLIRTPEDHPLAPARWDVAFEGVPNTGDITIPLSYMGENQNYNAVGNPYPSPISITKFIDSNSDVIDGTIWLWKKTAGSTKSSYITVTKLGYQANTLSDTNLNNPFALNPEGVIDTAQGFIVRAKNNEELVFNNAMRMVVDYGILGTDDADEPLDANRMWINVTGANIFSQALIGYTAEASLGYDNGLDGQALMDSGVTLYTIGDDKKFAIQARPEFNEEDVVKLGFKTQVGGTFEITLDHVDGIFTNSQNIYLKDNTNGTIHNLSNGSYSFNTAVGTFEDRFEIVYSDVLSTHELLNSNTIIVYSNNGQVNIKSSQEEIKSVTIYDIAGRLIYNANGINSTLFSSLSLTHQIVIARITLSNGQVISKKIMIQ